MKRTFLFAIIASILSTATYANQVVTSQTYVDNADARKVDIAQGVGTNNANVGKTLVVNSSGNLELGTVSADNFIEDSITDGVTDKAPSENAVHDALADKQDTIPARSTKIDNSDNTYAPSVVTNGTTDGTVGQMAIITGTRMFADGLNWEDYHYNDDLIPTLGAVGLEVQNIWNAIIPFAWNNTTSTAAVNNYSTTFNGTTNNWLTNQSTQYIQGNVFANGLALKQNKIPAHAANVADSVLTDSTTAGVVQKRTILDMDTYDENYGWEDLAGLSNMIPDAGTVGSAIGEIDDTKQNKLGGSASTAGKVVTATATAGNVTYTGIDTTVTNASSNLVTSGAVYTAVSTKQNQMTCTRWLNNIETDENCLLWSIE